MNLMMKLLLADTTVAASASGTGAAGKAGVMGYLTTFLPLILILPKYWQLTGVQMTQMLADLLTVACCIPFLLRFFRDLKKLEEEQTEAAEDQSI